MSEPIIDIRGLTVSYASVTVLHAVDLSVHRGETVAIVGPSGSGKTTLLRAVLGILDPPAEVTGTIRIEGSDLVSRSERDFRALRGTLLGYVGQDPFTSMDPLMTVGTNIAQGWRIKHERVPHGRIVDDLTAFDISRPAERVRQRPFTWSGGMLQRASVTTARALRPPVILADEPTHALDEPNAHRVLAALTEGAAALLIVSHDRELVDRYADRVYRVEGGTLIEAPPTRSAPTAPPAPRERKALPAKPILTAKGVVKRYPTGAGLPPTTLEVRRGEIVAITGASGAGKSTLLRLLAGIESPDAGSLSWDGRGGPPPPGAVGIVFQDALGSLAPHRPIYRSVTEPLVPRLRDRMSRTDALALARTALHRVGLGDLDPTRRPAQLSGGQAQRVAIARALVGDVRLLLADEPTAALDAASAAQVLELLSALADDGTAVVLVSHARRTVEQIADTVVEIP
ncbi:ABC transporter ATP-binding protein [Nocardia callitridis]|uniref:ABC transporter ATP-binding protein n=1 Tax=Nocardia callitridis TaxID=648753 RepID=A0ABP9K8K8_9NOCA